MNHWKSPTLWGAHGLAGVLTAIAADHGNPVGVRCAAITGAVLLPIANQALHLVGQLFDVSDLLTRALKTAWAWAVKWTAHKRSPAAPSTAPSSKPTEPS